MAAPKLVDALILGGGPAGLAAATGLARQLHTAIVFSHGKFRNARAKHMHNVPTWDHRDPAEFRAKAKADILARYETIQFKDVEITSVKRTEAGSFEAVDAAGSTYAGRTVVLATGVTDVMLPIEGFEELWGHSIFHCLFCHGFEERGAQSAGVLATGMLANPQFASGVSHMAANLAANVTVYTNGNTELEAELRKSLKSTKKFHIDTRKVTKLVNDPSVPGDAGLIVALEDGTQKQEMFLAAAPEMEINGPFVKDFGLDITPMGFVDVVPPFNATKIPGLFAAGDCATMAKAVAVAVSQGSMIAAGVGHYVDVLNDVEE